MNMFVDANSVVPDKQAQIWACLQSVTDPELDESVVELKFVTNADVDADNHVHIGFRLPTYWCAANFSFLMADDMRQAVQTLDWVTGVTVILGEHMYADKINAGLSQGLSFQDTFGSEADGNLDDIRQTFLVKAFQRRQVTLLNYLTANGYLADQLIELTLSDLECLPLEAEGEKLVRRYFERRHVVGPIRPDAFAFITSEGAALESETYAAYVTGLRRIGVNAEFNGALCRGLLAVRFDLDTPYVPSGEKPEMSQTAV